MILYSITINIENDVHDAWLHWMKTVHVPDIVRTGLFVDNKILRLLDEYDNGGTTYSFQYYLNSMEDYIIYQNEYDAVLETKHTNKFKDKFVTFKTILEVVE